jgi:hypothetical protein
MSIVSEVISDVTALVRALRSRITQPSDDTATAAPEPVQGAGDSRPDESQADPVGAPA